MGRERVERLRGPTLGCKDRDRPIDAAGSQEFRSVTPDRSDPAPQVYILPFQSSQSISAPPEACWQQVQAIGMLTSVSLTLSGSPRWLTTVYLGNYSESSRVVHAP